MSDQLTDGRRFRALTIVDVFTRESLAIEVGQALKGTDVVEVLNRLRFERSAPKMLFCDKGSEFSSQIMDLWAYQNGVKIDFSRPGKPTDNAYVESFNGTIRTECLDTHWFATLAEAKESIEAWRKEYNKSCPHRALGERPPNEFANEIAASRDFIGQQTAENSPWNWYKKPVRSFCRKLTFAVDQKNGAAHHSHELRTWIWRHQGLQAAGAGGL